MHHPDFNTCYTIGHFVVKDTPKDPVLLFPQILSKSFEVVTK